ncbi:MAG: hypothetical protein V4685_14885, partial [Bacteroidota bacterium]
MKKVSLFSALLYCSQLANAQTSFAKATLTDGEKFIEQKENVITEKSIIKIENLGLPINTEYPELRPTISADGQ